LDSDVVPSLEDENRYRSEAETLRKAAGELARRRQAVEAARTADCDDLDPAKEQNQSGTPELEVLQLLNTNQPLRDRRSALRIPGGHSWLKKPAWTPIFMSKGQER